MSGSGKGSRFEGGCQRGAGIITSSGIRGGEDVKTKATRTLWRLLSDITTAMPYLIFKNRQKNEGTARAAPHKCQLVEDTTVYD